MNFCTGSRRPCRAARAYSLWPTSWGPSEDVDSYRWWADARRAKGALSELGAHMIDVARWYLGDVIRVSGVLRTFPDQRKRRVLRPDGYGSEG
jgi:predicted dehydrogenase